MVLITKLYCLFYEPFNKDEDVYVSRCDTIINSTFEADTTINIRRSKIFNGSAFCSPGCNYTSYDKDSDYLECQCDVIDDNSEHSYTIADDILGMLPDFNLEIINCYIQVFTEVSLLLINN